MRFGSSSLETLRVFEACARHGSYTRAAAELGISPAAVSQRMRRLRVELGTAVFRRNGPQIALTQAGEQLARQVSDALALLAAAVAECKGGAAIRVSAAPTFAARWLTPRLGAFTACHGFSVELDPATDLRLPSSFDVAIRSGLGNWKGFTAACLFPIDRTPLYNPDRYTPPKIDSPADLLDCTLIESDDWPAWFEAVGQPFSKLPKRSGVKYPTQDLAGTAALEGAGIALLSPRMFESALQEGRLVQPFETTVSGPEAYWALMDERESRTPVTTFWDWLVKQCHDTLRLSDR